MAKKKTSKFKGKFKGKVSKDSQKRQMEGGAFGYLNLPKGMQIFKEPPGERVQLDILPYIVSDPNHMDRDDEDERAQVGEPWYKKPFKVHRRCIGVNNDDGVCPTTIGKKCPICEYRAKRLKEGADYQDDEIKALRPSLRNLYAVRPLKHKKYEDEIHIWNMSQFLFQDKLDEEVKEDEEREAFPDPEDGLTLKIRFSEEKFGKNTYADTSRIDFIERNESYSDKYLEDVPDLDKLLKIHSYKQLEKMFFELDDEPEPEEDVNEESEGEESEDEQEQEQEQEAEGEEEPEPEESVLTNIENYQDLEKLDKDDLKEAAEELDIKTKGKKSNKLIDEIAEGLGLEQEQEAEGEEEPEEDKKNKENDCPHGYTFGTDCEEYSECDDCEKWESCIDKKEEMEEDD